MRFRQAKKLLRLSHSGDYSPSQVYTAILKVTRTYRRHGRTALERIALNMTPTCHTQVDSHLDLRRLALKGQHHKATLPTNKDFDFSPPPPPVGKPDVRPVYRADGQVHNFNVVPSPWSKPTDRMTLKRHEALMGGDRPVPKGRWKE